jgi:murein DD-endopeptidase MepM/ murein hydrolase activator NlpD
MKTTKMLGVALFFTWMMLYPVSQTYAYFAEDSFAPFWDQNAQQINPAPVGQPAKTEKQSGAPELTHRVAEGETLWSLARHFHVELARLMSVNKIADPTCLSVGMVLVIPGGGVQAGARQQPEAVGAVARGWNGNLIWPLLGELTQQFGPQANGMFHHGLDIAGNTGTPVRAAQRGIVVRCGWLPFYGFAVIIDHGSGFRTLYAHLHDFAVRAGDMVGQGQVIAHVGSTGNATGPHLHFEVRQNNQTVNPLPYLGN